MVEAADHTWVGHVEGFNINHNVAPASQALGANGCGDCHADEAHMFKGQIVTDMCGPDGKPATHQLRPPLRLQAMGFLPSTSSTRPI